MDEILLGPYTAAEREAYISAHVATCARTTRRKIAPGKHNGATTSVEAAKRNCANKAWKRKVKRHIKSGKLSSIKQAAV